MSEVALSYEFPETEELVLEEWQQPTDTVPLYCNFPLPVNVEPIVVKIEENYVEIDRSVKQLKTAERIALQALLKHRGEPTHTRDKDDLGPVSVRSNDVYQPYVALRSLRSKLRNFTTSEIFEESRDGDNQMQLRLSERVVYGGDVLSDPRIQDEDWYNQAACLNTDASAFDAETATSLGGGDPRKDYCKPCPVRADCLVDAVLKHEQHTIRGGLLGREVKKLGEFYRERDAS